MQGPSGDKIILLILNKAPYYLFLSLFAFNHFLFNLIINFMSYQTHILRVTSAGSPYPRTNEKTGETYDMFPYLIQKSNDPETIDLYLKDQEEAGYTPIKDKDTDLYIAFMFKPVLAGSRGIVRSMKGRWSPDMSNMRVLNSVSKEFPGLNLGKHVVEMLMKQGIAEAFLAPDQQADPQNDPTSAGIDPFKD